MLRSFPPPRRKQYMLDVARVPAFSKLYHVRPFISTPLLKCVERANSCPALFSRLFVACSRNLRTLCLSSGNCSLTFSEFDLGVCVPPLISHRTDLSGSIRSATLPSLETEKEAALLRRSLLESFAAYDALAKRIRALPCERGSTQERLQQAIGISAATFLQREMAPLQVGLPSMSLTGECLLLTDARTLTRLFPSAKNPQITARSAVPPLSSTTAPVLRALPTLGLLWRCSRCLSRFVASFAIGSSPTTNALVPTFTGGPTREFHPRC